MMGSKQWTHDDLAEDLASHLRGVTDRMVWTDFPMGPAGSMRPDVLAVRKSYDLNVSIYEIKISVADFRADVTAGKWCGYLTYATGVYFAVPKGLIGPKDLPPGAGLYVRDDAGWRAAKKPTLQRQPELPRNVWMKLLMDGIGHEVSRAEAAIAPRALREWQVAEHLRNKYGHRVAQAVADIERFEQQVADAAARAAREQAEYESRRQARWDADRQQFAKTRADFEGWVDGVRQELGLPPEASLHECKAVLRSRLDRLSERAEIAHLRRQMDAVRTALDAAQT